MNQARIGTRVAFLALALGILWACPFDMSLRQYLTRRFWMPFAKHPGTFERSNVRRTHAAFAGIADGGTQSAMDHLRQSYKLISNPGYDLRFPPSAVAKAREALAAVQTVSTLSPREREEVNLLDAKIDLREGQPETPELIERARTKLQKFLKTARTPEFLSEARGWLARVHYLLDDQTAAGKIYLDELNRNGSNLSRETLLNSLQMTYGYDGGEDLRANLDKYFDTPEHAAFAIQMVTNPHSHGDPRARATYATLKTLFDRHSKLLQTATGANSLALLEMRTALRFGDPAEARKIGEAVPETAAVQSEPDFAWILASSNFLLHDFAAAEKPLLALHRSKLASLRQRAAAAYALCGVYSKTGNAMEQLRYALWLRDAVKQDGEAYLSHIGDLSVYLAISGWDLNLMLEFGAPIEVLRKFIAENRKATQIRLVQYALAVRLARENHYEESAAIYQSIGANLRAARMRRLMTLHSEMNRTDLQDAQRLAAKYAFAEYLAANSDRLYFNDLIWDGYQSYVFQAGQDGRLTRAEREALIAGERKLKDDQEERWRAYLILREVARDSGAASELGKKSATLAMQTLRRISERFGRADEIHKGEIDLAKWLRNPSSNPL